MMILFIYLDQLKQADQRIKIEKRLDMQSEVKLQHPMFGSKYKSFFKLMYLLYFLDTLLIPNIIQLLVLIFLLSVIYLWDFIVKRDHWSLLVILRVIQLVCISQALLTFSISMPVFADSWQQGKSLLTFGICQQNDTIEEKAYTRTHYGVLCSAIVATQVFFKSHSVHQSYM